MPIAVAAQLLQITQPLISDAAVKILADAGVAICLVGLMAMGLWVLIKPLVASRAAKDSSNDAVTNGLLKQSADAHEDNRRLIEVIEKGREDDRVQTAAITALTLSIETQAAATKEQTATTMKLVDVVIGQSQFTQQQNAKLPGVMQGQHDETVKRMTEAMNTTFAEVLRQVGELRGMVEKLATRSDTDHKALVADVKVILERIDTIQKSASAEPPLPDAPTHSDANAAPDDAEPPSSPHA